MVGLNFSSFIRSDVIICVATVIRITTDVRADAVIRVAII